MQTTISQYDFRGAFMGSDTYKHNFSYEALGALYDYLTELEDCLGEQIEFDMVAICCEYTEFSDWQEFATEYKCFVENENVSDLQDLADYTCVIPLTGNGFIIADF